MSNFKVGDKVQVKKDLQVGARYFNANREWGETFTSRMVKYLGADCEVVKVTKRGGYQLSIDNLHVYTDEMLQAPIDYLAKEPYNFHPDVEDLIIHLKKDFYKKQMDKALDERMFEKNPEEFKKIFESYRNIC